MLTSRNRSRIFSISLALLAACSDAVSGSEGDAGVILPGVDASSTPGGDSAIGFPSFDASGYDAGGLTYDSGGADDGMVAVSDGSSVASDGSIGVVVPSGGFIRGPAPTKDSASKAGPYKVTSITNGFRDGPKFADATLWWPTDADAPFASVAIVPGWVSGQGDIQPWGPFLASHGIVALTIGTNSPATDLPQDRANALIDALETLRQENTRTGAALAGKLDLSRLGTMGWSMGGGGTLLVGEQQPTIKATIAMAPWNPGYSYSKLTVPALLFAGTVDILAGGQSQPFYESIPAATPKELLEVTGADHWNFNNPKNNNGDVGRYGLSWLKVFLEGDARYLGFLKEKPTEASDFRNNL